MPVAEVAAADLHHLGHQRARGLPLVEVALDRGELPSQVAGLALPLEAVDEVPGVRAVPLGPHALGNVDPVALGLPTVLL